MKQNFAVARPPEGEGPRVTFEQYFTGTFDWRGEAVWSSLRVHAARYSEPMARLVARSLGADVANLEEGKI
jgi:hypothetical protein